MSSPHDAPQQAAATAPEDAASMAALASSPEPLAALTLLQRAKAFSNRALLYQDSPAELEVEIAEAARQQSVRTIRPLITLACTLGLLWWPLDFVLYAQSAARPDRPQRVARRAHDLLRDVLHHLRSVGVGPAPITTRGPPALAVVMSCSSGAILGSLGSLEQPWFWSLYLVPIITFPFLARLPVRILAVTVTIAAMLFGAFVIHPQNISHPYFGTYLGVLVFSSTLSVCVGHAIYHSFRVNHLQSKALTKLSNTLAAQVDARTVELRALAAHAQALHESSRAALARELHDELGQLLTGMRLELDVAASVRARGGDVGYLHNTLVSLLDATLLSMRSILAHLRPRILDDFGLVAALEWLAQDARERSGLDVRFESSHDDIFAPEALATAIFRIAQESLTNALKHARAQIIDVDLALEGAHIIASISDDGVGLPPKDEQRPLSMGLLGMRERATGLDGELLLYSPPNGGTRVIATFPLETNAHEETS